MSIIKLNSENFENEVLNYEGKVLIDFYADWCGPCRMVAPLVEQIANECPQYAVGKVNVDNCPEISQQFGVMSIPTLVVLKGGEEVNRAVGSRPKAQILALLEG